MKIVHVGKYFHPKKGGIENYLYDLSVSQAKLGHEVSVLVHNDDYKQKTESYNIGNLKVKKIKTHAEIVYVPISLTFCFHLHKVIKDMDPDIIHVHLPNVSAFYLLLFSKYPIVVHWHSDVVPSNIDRRLSFFYKFYSLFESLLLKKSAKIIATSKNYIDSSEPLAQYSAKVDVVPLSYNPGRLPSINADKCNSIREHYQNRLIFSVGRFTYYKGFENLIYAAQFVDDACVVIAGDGPLFTKIKQLVKKVGVENKVKLLGQIDDQDLANYYSACDCFCLPSIERTEAFGLVLLEAMNYSKPLVTTSVYGSGMNFVNVDNVTGLHAEPDNPGSLAEKINTILSDNVLAQTFGKNANKRFREVFDLEATVQKISEIYSIIQTPPTSG